MALLAACASAAITSSGDVSPDPTTIPSTGYLNVGYNSHGDVTVDGGSTLLLTYANIGINPGVTGDVTVSGAGSLLRADWGITLGRGQGSLNIANGGVVDASTTTVIPGSGSTIQLNGGTLASKSLQAEEADLRGVGTINT